MIYVPFPFSPSQICSLVPEILFSFLFFCAFSCMKSSGFQLGLFLLFNTLQFQLFWIQHSEFYIEHSESHMTDSAIMSSWFPLFHTSELAIPISFILDFIISKFYHLFFQFPSFPLFHILNSAILDILTPNSTFLFPVPVIPYSNGEIQNVERCIRESE